MGKRLIGLLTFRLLVLFRNAYKQLMTRVMLRWNERMLSRDCDGCECMSECQHRFAKVNMGEKVFCPDGTAHLV